MAIKFGIWKLSIILAKMSCKVDNKMKIQNKAIHKNINKQKRFICCPYTLIVEMFVYISFTSLQFCIFIFLSALHGIFVNIMENFHISTSRMKWFQWITTDRLSVAKLSGFRTEEGFKLIRNVLWKYNVVIFDFIFDQTANWKWLFNLYIIASFRTKVTYNVATLEISFS